MSAPYGFLDYQEDDSTVNGGIGSVILSVECTSQAAVLAAGLTLSGTGHNFSAQGMKGNATRTAGLTMNSATTSNATYAARAAELKNAGHITLWVENSVVDVDNDDTLAARGMLSFGSNFYPEIQRTRNAQNMNLLANNFATVGGGSAAGESFYGVPVDESGFSRIDISWVNNMGAVNYTATCDLYLNKQLIARNSGTANPNWDHTLMQLWTRYWGGDGIIDSAGRLYRVQVSTRPIMLPFARPHLEFAAFGDSLTYNGSLGSAAAYLHGTSQAGEYGVAGFIHGIRRLFAKHNLMPYILGYGVIGNSSASFATQITQCFVTEKQRPKYAHVLFGANDSSGGVSDTTFDTNIRAGLTTLFDTYGLTKVFIGKPPTISWHASYTAQVYKDRIDAYGVKIEAMKASYPNLVVLDYFTALRGHTDESFFRKGDGTIDQHPNSKGNKAMQDVLLTSLESMLNWNA